MPVFMTKHMHNGYLLALLLSKPLDKVKEQCLVKYSTQAHDVLGLTKASLVGIDRQLIIDLLPDYCLYPPQVICIDWFTCTGYKA
jgi:hypothetical protein